MSKTRIAALLTVILIVTLACSFSFSANLGKDEQNSIAQNTETENIVENEVEPVEETGEDEPAANENSDNDVEFVATEPQPTQNTAQSVQNVQDADEVYEEPGDSNDFTSPAGQIYVEVLIKSGPDVVSFTEDLTNACYEIIGLGTSSLVVNRIGDGRDCKEIGILGLIYGE